MMQWKSDLVGKIIANKVKASNGKYYIQCPYCNAIEIENHEFHDDGTDTVKIHPSVSISAFIHIPEFDCYGECAHCSTCGTSFYICDADDDNSLMYINQKDIDSKRVFIEKMRDDGTSVFINRNFIDAIHERKLKTLGKDNSDG